MDSFTKLLQELEVVLRSFKLHHFELYVLPEFPETNWSAIGYLVKRRRMLFRSSSIAQILTSIVQDCGLNENDLEERIATLRIYAVALNGTKQWNTFELSEPNRELRLVTATTLAPRVGRNLSAKFGARGLAPEVHSIKHVDSYWFSVVFFKLSTKKRTPPIYFVTQPGKTMLFASKKPVPNVLESICNSLGYDSFKDIKLKGTDLKSLYRVLEQSHNKPLSRLNGLPEYRPVPELTPTGIDYTQTTYNAKYVDSILGDNPPLLNSLEVTASEPYFNAENEGMDQTPMKMRIEIRSTDAAKTLKEMVKRNIIKPDSIWLNFFQQTRRNQIKLRVERR